MRRSSGALFVVDGPSLLVVGCSVPRWVRQGAMLSALLLSCPSSGASMWVAP
jgi:hypothetical protein